MAQIIKRTHDASLAGQVSIAHACCYTDAEPDEFQRLANATGAADITLATCALGADPVLPVAALQRAGVRVVLGSDGVRDAWSPFGNGNMLDRTHLFAWRSGATTDTELESCIHVAAQAGADLVGLERSTLQVGAPADFMLIHDENPAQAVVDRPT